MSCAQRKMFKLETDKIKAQTEMFKAEKEKIMAQRY